jgi:hypothetical protein
MEYLHSTAHDPFVPAKAGTQDNKTRPLKPWPWVPAFAGTNGLQRFE